MEQQVRFCGTVDGVQVAYSTEGSGAPYVWIPGATQAERLVRGAWGAPLGLTRRWSRVLKVVLYDARGFGLSAAATPDLSLEKRLCDLDAVVAAVGETPVVLRGMADAAGVAIAFAATRPASVAALVLFGPYASGSALASLRPGMHDALLGLLKAEPSLGMKALLTVISGETWPESVDDILPVETLELILEGMRTLEVTDYLAAITAPALVIHGREDLGIPIMLGRAVAAGIPNARLYEYDGPHTPRSLQIVDGVTAAISEFLGVDAPLGEASGDVRPAFRTVLFTDIVNHTEMMQRLGDERGRAVLRDHDRITRDTLAAFGGTEVKTMGDGFMASFGSVTAAMDCAIALQRALAAWNADGAQKAQDDGRPSLQVRVGLNAGEPIEEEGDLFGSTVILASRIAAQAGAGEILIPEPLRHLLSGKSYVYSDRGEAALKGFDEAVRLYEVHWQEG